MFFIWGLSSVSLLGQQNFKDIYLENQPKDPFIDALRPRLKDSLLLSYLAYRDGEYAIEATTVIPGPASQVLDFYKKQFDEHGFPYQVKEWNGMTLFMGMIDGESKKVFLSKMPQGTLVHLISEKTGLQFASLLERHPELGGIDGQCVLHNEQHQGVSRTGLLKYDFNTGGEYGLRNIENKLVNSGWKPSLKDTFKKAGIDAPDGIVGFFEKDSVTLMVVPARSSDKEKGSVLVYFEDTFGVPRQKHWTLKQ